MRWFFDSWIHIKFKWNLFFLTNNLWCVSFYQANLPAQENIFLDVVVTHCSFNFLFIELKKITTVLCISRMSQPTQTLQRESKHLTLIVLTWWQIRRYLITRLGFVCKHKDYIIILHIWYASYTFNNTVNESFWFIKKKLSINEWVPSQIKG